jgi:predicted SprT family Zn-dependent metalloprotease
MTKKTRERITGREYTAFDDAYDWFNNQLFAGKLPPCLITLQRKARSRGYFANERFGHRTRTKTLTDELALNPDTFIDRSDKEILSTLVHEMVHCWQEHHGHPSRKGYHNQEWAEKMIEIGLMPSDTGAPDGRKTGQHVTHYIVPQGPFDQAAKALLQTGFILNWQSVAPDAKQTRARDKTKFQCPSCKQNAWAKPTAALICGECEIAMEAQA